MASRNGQFQSDNIIGGTGVSPVLARACACGYISHLAFLAAHAKCLPDTPGFKEDFLLVAQASGL
jgi:hypothetical protein